MDQCYRYILYYYVDTNYLDTNYSDIKYPMHNYCLMQTQAQRQQQRKIKLSMLQMNEPYIGSELSQSMFRGYFNLTLIFCIFFIFVYPTLNYWEKGRLFETEVIELLQNNLVLDLVGFIIFLAICLIAFVIPQEHKREVSVQITFIGVILLCLHYIIVNQTSSYSDRAFIIMMAWGFSGKLYSYFNISDGTDTLKNKLMFLFIPTILYCNDINTLRDKTLIINKLYVFKKSIIAVLALLTNCVIIIDFINPIIAKHRDLSFLELMLKLIAPSFYLATSLFYLVYQNVFSGMSQLLKLKDRKFFSDWWNSQNFYDLLEKGSLLPKQFMDKHFKEGFRIPLLLFITELIVLQCYKKHFTFNAGILYIAVNLGIYVFGKTRDYFGLNNYLVHIVLLCFMPFILSLELKYRIF